MLIIICGLPGSGKTVVAKRIAEITKAILLRTDVIRKELIKQPTYSEEETEKTYEEMFLRARRLLEENKNVVLEATFAKREWRFKAIKIAEASNADFKIVEVVCSENVIKERINRRTGDESDADFKIHLKYKNLFEPIMENHIVINNSGLFEETEKQINQYFIL